MLTLKLLNPELISEKGEQYKKFTYPTYRPLLEKLQDSRYIAISAEENQEILGLTIGEIDQEQSVAKILSLFVRPESRKQGIGNQLFTAIEAELKAKDCQQIDLIYIPNHTVAGLEKILQRNGWSRPKPRMLICIGIIGSIKNASWLNLDKKLPQDYEVFPWLELTSEERNALKTSQQESPWYPEILSPFKEEGIIEPINSLGIRYKNQVVGWMITHRISNQTIRYTSLFIKEELQSIGRGIALLAQAIKLQISYSETSQASFTVELDNEKMVKFTERRLKPYLASCRRSFISSKFL